MPKNISKKTNKREKSKRTVEDNPLKPIDIDKELEGVENFLIKVIVFIETFVLNTFIYSIKLVTDLPKLLAYLTPVDRYRVAKSAFIMSIIYNALHLLTTMFGTRLSFIPKPVFHRFTAITTLVVTSLLLIISLKYSNKYILENPQEEDEEDEEDEYEDGYPPSVDTKDTEQSTKVPNFTRKENIEEANTWNDDEEDEEWGDNRLPKETSQITKKEHKTVQKQLINTSKTPINKTKPIGKPHPTLTDSTLSDTQYNEDSQESILNNLQTKESLFTNQVDTSSPFIESESPVDESQEPLEDYNINIMNLLTGSGIDISVSSTDDDEDIKLLFEDHI